MRTLRTNPEDEVIIEALTLKLGLEFTPLVRLALRKLAEQELIYAEVESMLEGIQEAARLAARLGLFDLGKYDLEAPMKDLWYCLEHSPDNPRFAVDAARGMLELERNLGVKRMMKAGPVYDIIRDKVIRGQPYAALAKQHQLTSVWVLTYRAEVSRTGEEKTAQPE